MAKDRIEPSFVRGTTLEGELLVGEFHHGSASDPEVLSHGMGIKCILTDPPYNIGHNYGPEVNDRLPVEEYHQMMEDVFDACYEAADDDASLFIIHYPQELARMWPCLTNKWKFHQWITWAYPANFGHSSKKWTNASRTILWLVKGEPEFYGERVVQPYRNPTDSRIRKLIHEEGQKGTNLYNWWQVNLCKNVSKDKKEYSNQIPEALLERIILSTTNLGDLIADPFAGTFSTCRTAMKLGRRAWGCDLNSEVIKWRPTADEYIHNPVIPEQQFDQEYPFNDIEEAGLTEQQFEKIVVHFFENVSAPDLSKSPGIGIKKAREFVKNVRKQEKLGDYDEPNPIDEEECITKEEMSAIIKELNIPSKETLLEDCYNKRLENLNTAKNPKRWLHGPEITKEDLKQERRENAFDIEKWSAKYTPLYNSGEYTVGVCRPGKEAVVDHTMTSYNVEEYYNKDDDEVISEVEYSNLDDETKEKFSKRKKEITNPDDMLPVIIIDGGKNIAQSTTQFAWNDKPKIIQECERLGIPTTASRESLINKYMPKSANPDRTKELAEILDLSTDGHTNKVNIDLIRQNLSTLNDEERINLGEQLGKDITATKEELKQRLINQSGSDLKVYRFTPWTLHDLKRILSLIYESKCGPLLVEIIGILLARMAYMLDHHEKEKGHWKYSVPPKTLSILQRQIPMIDFKGSEVPLEQFLQMIDILSINEDIKVDRKGISNLKENAKNSGKGRVNTLLTYAHWASIQGQMTKLIDFDEQWSDSGRAEISVPALLDNLKFLNFRSTSASK